VLELVRQASADPDVLAIKQTLYRVGNDSPLVDQLIEAARQGKDVTVVVELRARFDEEANLRLANRLQEAGVQVVYGIVGYKTHAKMLLIVRREQGVLRRYAHLSTGNYHQVTSRLYTDFGLMTANPEIGEDAHLLFLQLSGLGPIIKLKCLLHSPFTLHKGLMEKIEREIAHAAAGKPARIIAKMNALNEESVVEVLYRASRAGVQIELIIRGACTLRPGIPGVSDNIRVRSIVGRFLEHSRVYWFQNDDTPKSIVRAPTGWSATCCAASRRVSLSAIRSLVRASTMNRWRTISRTTRKPGSSTRTATTRESARATTRRIPRSRRCSRSSRSSDRRCKIRRPAEPLRRCPPRGHTAAGAMRRKNATIARIPTRAPT
jgi:hypothetical protein